MKEKNINVELEKRRERSQIHRILDMVLDRNEAGKTTFFRFAGHVNMIEIDMNDKKWTPSSVDKVITMSAYLDADYSHTLDELEEALCWN